MNIDMRHLVARLPWRTFVFWLVVAAALIVPTQFGLAYVYGNHFIWKGLVASIGLVGVLIASSWCIIRARKIWVMTVGAAILISFFFRMLFFGVARFSGRGFDNGFFLSLQAESAGVAWNQYLYLFLLLGVGLAILLVVIVTSRRRLRAPSGAASLVLVAISIAASAYGYRTYPMWQLMNGAYNWFGPRQINLPPSRLAAWRESPLIHLHLTPKRELKAVAANPPKNLIFLYIESGGVAMAPTSQYPGLTPNLRQLIEKYSFVPHIHASSYITIEGLVNTQCGTLLPFGHGNDSVAGFGHMVEKMPCLGDVLAKAGYRQSYLGGAGSTFSGKGQFLKRHGYDKVVGLEDWVKKGLYPESNTWGLSDVDLFKQSFKELKRLKESGHPFNLTLLTLGTHIPGFVYKGCPRYGDGSDRFLNAIYCTDHLVGQWVNALKDDGWLDDNTILVITADHQIFPNPQMKKLFGDEAVANHQLPLIVIGNDLPAPVQHDGAGYDIAPTILDLLGIKTNAEFAMGRSLLRDSRKLDYFPSRYIDMLGEERYLTHNKYHCDVKDVVRNPNRVPGEQPLNSCERKELNTILYEQAVKYSAMPPRLNCGALRPLYAAVPKARGDGIKIQLSGTELAGHFYSDGRQINAAQPGLYVLVFDAHGKLIKQEYTSPDDAGRRQFTLPRNSSGVMLVAWRPPVTSKRRKLVTIPGLPDVGANGGVWVYSLRGTSPPLLEANVKLGQELNVSARRCHAMLGSNGNNGHG